MTLHLSAYYSLGTHMDFLQAGILGIVEGLTEFLPVSSTGHLILTTQLLALKETDFVKAFTVIIQSAAMLAVMIEYREKFILWIKNLTRWNPKTKETQECWSLFCGTLPVVVLGLVFGSQIKAHLFTIEVVSWSLVLGGFLILLMEGRFKAEGTQEAPFQVPPIRTSLKIGFFQCLALIPGTSRSLVTIWGSRFMGLSKVDATIYSFYLAVPTLVGASLYDLYKFREVLFGDRQNGNLLLLVVGFVTSFIVAWLCIRLFLGFVRRFSFKVFGVYRILVGILFLVFF